VKPVDLKLHPHVPTFRWLAERVWSVEHAFERAKAEARPEEDTRVRIFIVLAVFSFVFAVLVLGAAKAALFSGAESPGAASTPAASRADLVDRNGLLIATNLTHFGLYIDPDEVWDVAETRRKLLAAAPALSPTRLNKALRAEHRSYVLGGLTPQDRARIHALALPGVSFEEEDKRVYPLGHSAAHIVGFADSGGKGIAGVERTFDKTIREAGRTGAAVPLSIDLRIQAALEDEVAATAADQQASGAVGIVTDITTGEVLAMTSWPSYDPGQAGKAPDWAKLNRAATQVYEMGSTFKVFTVAAGLDSGKASLTSTFDATAPMQIGERRIHDSHALNRVLSLADVFIHSSNIGTSKLALGIGSDTMSRYFRALGLFEPAKIELAESARPLYPRKWSDSTLASVSFGQAISVTPLQLAAAMGAVLNGGTYVPLTLHKQAPGARVQGRRVVSPETSRAMLDLMRLNVTNGTGSKADALGLSVGGKTGSAQKVIDGRYAATRLVSSFAAVFPTDGPMEQKRYFVLILVDDPHGSAQSMGQRTGGWTAAPAVGRVIDRIAPFLGVQRRLDPLGLNRAAGAPLVEDAPAGDDE
jgi:cell division protein FtsI (penicillin-binding protein 3)